MKILFSNLGYARGIDGSLQHHLRYAGRYFYTPRAVQELSLSQFRSVITQERPDLCCLVELDRGSFQSSQYNQILSLADDEYCFHDTANKYGEKSWLNWLPLHGGKSNALLGRHNYTFRHIYFTRGSKRLIYQVTLPGIGLLFFAHFSLNRRTRLQQLAELKEMIRAHEEPALVLADFNIFQGYSELRPLLEGTDLVVLNDPAIPTFTFHRRALTLDLCICSQKLVERCALRIIPQPFSDHAALLLEITP